MSAQSEGQVDPLRALRHPLWWGALLVLVVNDHVLKGAGYLPAALTGKLSDVAGLIVAPVVLAAVLALVFRLTKRRAMLAAVASVGAWFALVNLWPAATQASERVAYAFGVPWTLWCDPTDLFALPALGVSVWLMTQARDVKPRRALEGGLAILGAVACVATSVAPPAAPVSTQGKVLSQPVGKGPVFVIDASTGRRMAAPAFNQNGATVLEANGVLYGVLGKRVVGISLQTEQEVMRFDYAAGTLTGGALTDGSRIFSLARGNGANERVVAVDLRSNKLAWDKALPGKATRRGSSRRPILAGGLVVVPIENRLVAFDPATGAQQWVHEAKAPLFWPTTDGPRVFVVDDKGTIDAIDLQKGTLLWRHAVGSFDGFDGRYFGGPRLGAGSDVLAFMRGDKLTAIDAATRAPRWKMGPVDDVVVGRTVSVARMEIDGDDHLVGIRMTNGERLWKLDAESWMSVDPTIDEANGLVLIRPSSSELRAYTLDGGKLIWRFLLNEGHRADELR